ncbi:MAG: signal peptidase I, partial [Pedobacter sp.]
MEQESYLGVWLVLGLITLLSMAGLWKLFQKAGRQGWEAIVPIYNFWVMLEIVQRPKWWILLYLIPVVNLFVLIGVTIDLVKCFGKFKFIDHALAVLVPFIVLPLWGFDKDLKFLGASASEDFKKKYTYKKSKSREWADAIIFAVVAATVIRVFFIEAYVIPSGSMERSLLIGDYLFVSKVNYGARIPM